MARVAAPEERFRFDAGRAEVGGAYACPDDAVATLVLAHGAGAGMDHPFLVGFARAINGLGVATLRFDFPYMASGRRSPDPEPSLRAAWTAAFEQAVGRSGGLPVWVGGKSLGGRIASMVVADGMPAAGLVFLGYPLHPPGKPERVRDEHLYRIGVPMLFLHGTRDAFAQPELLKKVLSKLGSAANYVPIEAGDHSFNVRGRKRSAREVGADLAPTVASFIREHG